MHRNQKRKQLTMTCEEEGALALAKRSEIAWEDDEE